MRKRQVVIIQPPSEGKTYAEVLNKTKAGGILLGVKGKQKADKLT